MPMFDRILVPLDGSRQAESILGPLRSLLLRMDAEVILSQAIHLPPATGSLEAKELEASTYLASRRAELESWGARVRTMVRQGKTADVILQAVKETQASLVAMATHGRSGVIRWMLGSVTEDVLRRSEVPVLVAGAHLVNPSIETVDDTPILMPFDGSRESLSVAPLVLRMAKLLGAKVAVLRVEGPSSGGSDLGFVGMTLEGPANGSDRPDFVDRDLLEVGTYFTAGGVRAMAFRVRGNTAERINLLARLLNVRMIAMATHGRQGLSRLITGSVAEEVLRQANVSVLIQRIGAPPSQLGFSERKVS